jgi:N-acetylmuramoyl-L-alanine amidase
MLCIFGLAGCASAPKLPPRITELPARPIEPPEPLPPPPTPRPVPVTAPAPPPVPAILTNTWIPLSSWCQYHGFERPQRASTAAGGLELRTSRGTLVLAAGNRIATWKGVGFWLGFKPQTLHDQLYVHRLDAERSLLPLLSAARSTLKPGAIILIDPGHGGRTPGTVNVANGRWEKEFTLDWALRIQRLLVTNNCKVYLTRTNDVDIALSNRVTLADQLHADLFVSLHFNSISSNREPNGIETYCTTPCGMPSSVSRDYDDNPATVFPNNGFDEQNLLLALQLHRSLITTTGAADRTVRRARFLGVLRQQNRPAVLIEGGYLSNPKEARSIADPAYRQRLSEAVARVLRERLSPPVSLPIAEIAPGNELERPDPLALNLASGRWEGPHVAVQLLTSFPRPERRAASRTATRRPPQVWFMGSGQIQLEQGTFLEQRTSPH